MKFWSHWNKNAICNKFINYFNVFVKIAYAKYNIIISRHYRLICDNFLLLVLLLSGKNRTKIITWEFWHLVLLTNLLFLHSDNIFLSRILILWVLYHILLFQVYSKLVRKEIWYVNFIFPDIWVIFKIYIKIWSLFGHVTVLSVCYINNELNGVGIFNLIMSSFIMLNLRLGEPWYICILLFRSNNHSFSFSLDVL